MALRPGRLARGVWGVVPTPFSGSGFDIDEPSLATLVGYYERIGVSGLTMLGVFGEAATLTREERRAVLEVALEGGGLPLVVGVTSTATAPAIEEVELARDIVGSRLAGVMLQVNSNDIETVRRHFRAVYEATGVGLVVQDYPLVTGVTISPTQLAAALGSDDFGLVAVKAEAPPTAVEVAVLADALPEVPIFGGLGGTGLLDELVAGAWGAMTGFAAPEGLLACVQGYAEGGYEAARAAFLPYLPLVNFEQQPKVGLAIRKEVLRKRGLILESIVRPPSLSMPDALFGQLEKHLAALGLPRKSA